MSDFNKEKLFVNIDDNLDDFSLSNARCYLLTHSDETGDLFLNVSENFDRQELPENKDHVMAQWVKVANRDILRVDLHIDGKNEKSTAIRDSIFRKELPLALTALVVGDEKFICNNGLDYSSVVVYFNSDDDMFNKVERWGCARDYLEYKCRDEQDRVVQIGEKDRVILTLLTPFIEKELNKLYGRKQFFCPNYSRVLSVRPLSPPFVCRGSYSVTVGIRVGFNPPKFSQQGYNQKEANEWNFSQQGVNIPGFNNVIIEFLVRSDGVKTQSVKSPR